jgi:hypothetical protein
MMHAVGIVFAEAGALQPFGTVLVLAGVAGMGAIATLLVAFGLGEAVASLLVAVEMPADYAWPVSVGVLAVAGALAVRFAIGAAVGDETLRFSPLIDKIGGTLIGGLAGLIATGTILVVLSALPIPAAYSIDGTQTKFDLGTRVLKIFATCIASNADARQVLLDGEAPAGEPTGGPDTSELFVDTNGNGVFDGEGEAAERHLDHDGNQSFTPRVAFTDTNGNGVRDIGLLERYRLGAWQKLRVLHYPTITSDATSVLTVILGDGQLVYKAVATDLDPDDPIAFSLRGPVTREPVDTTSEGGEEPTAGPEAGAEPAADTVVEPKPYEDPLFAIDATSGSVTVKDAKAFMRRKEPSQIIVVATDARGLSSEKVVSLIYRGVVPGE